MRKKSNECSGVLTCAGDIKCEWRNGVAIGEKGGDWFVCEE